MSALCCGLAHSPRFRGIVVVAKSDITRCLSQLIALGYRDLRPQRIAAPQLARVDPHVLLELTKRLLEGAYDRVVVGAVGDEQLGHVYPPAFLIGILPKDFAVGTTGAEEHYGARRFARRRS